MQRKLLRTISCGLLLTMAIFLGVPVQAASKKKDLEKQAQDAEQRGDVETAQSAYCELANEEKKSQDIRAKCDQYTQRADEQHKADANHLASGRAFLAQRRFDDAAREFKAVGSRQYRDQAAQQLALIPQMQHDQEQQRAAEERDKRDRAVRDDATRREDNYRQGLDAYQRNDFARAKTLLLGTGADHIGDAGQLMRKMDEYNRLLDEGTKFQKAGKRKQALDDYLRALAIKEDGPGDLKARVARLQPAGKTPDLPAGKDSKEPVAAGDDEELLVSGIGDFYNNDFASAEKKLANYNGSGAHKALALFYLGAAQLSRYYLTGAADTDKTLFASAVDRFRAARTVAAGFKPPEGYVSPRILKVFNESAQQ